MKKLKLGVIGTGSVVREIYQHFYFNSRYSSSLSVEGICDISAEGVTAFGAEHGLPPERCFTDYNEMIETLDLDAVAVNTPDSLHRDPVVKALEAGLDVLVPKPTADRIADAWAMVETAKRLNRFIGVDFHKRFDPRFKEARTRFRNGDYGNFQSAVFYMLDKLMVADPNHNPRFFASPDFAKKNTPVSFLTVHMADAFMHVTGLRPVSVRATGYCQKLPALKPVAVQGYDLVDTEVFFENGGIAHFITGWAIPNTAHSTTVQSARLIGSEGLLDLQLDMPGYREITDGGLIERNPMFMNFESDGLVGGYGMEGPGTILEAIQRFRSGEMSTDEYERWMSPQVSGVYTTIVCEAAHASLEQGEQVADGVVRGCEVGIKEYLETILGKKAAQSL